jgi:hypothetical protein
MRVFSKVQVLGAAGAALIVGVVAILAGPSIAADRSAGPFQAQPLTGKSADDIAKYALAFTASNVRIVSGAPTAPLVRTVTGSELPSLGLAHPFFRCGEPPLVFVLVRGDFDATGAGPGLTGSFRSRVDHIGYVFDVLNGRPVVEAFGGLDLRGLLHDPSLPGRPAQPTMAPRPGQVAGQPASAPPGSAPIATRPQVCDGSPAPPSKPPK